jgi:hypothetical protein
MRYISIEKNKKANIMFAFSVGVVSDDGLEPPTYAV